MSEKLIYVALPYTDKDKSIVDFRVKKFCEIDSQLNMNGILTVSPILKHLLFDNNSELPTDWDFWKNLSYRLLSSCDILLVLKLSGWEKSIGVNAEIEFAKQNQITTYYLEEDSNILDIIKKIKTPKNQIKI